jgi:hypothetical protein
VHNVLLMIEQLAKLIAKLRLEQSLITIQAASIYWNSRETIMIITYS